MLCLSTKLRTTYNKLDFVNFYLLYGVRHSHLLLLWLHNYNPSDSVAIKIRISYDNIQNNGSSFNRIELDPSRIPSFAS